MNISDMVLFAIGFAVGRIVAGVVYDYIRGR